LLDFGLLGLSLPKIAVLGVQLGLPSGQLFLARGFFGREIQQGCGRQALGHIGI
jgi:hypothetical protein